jgi:hypothetical protein
MIKALSAIAFAALIATALTILPGFAPTVEASVPQALAKGDRLDIRPVGKDCSQQAWPNFEASCLRVAGAKPTAKSMIREARLVTADRTP